MKKMKIAALALAFLFIVETPVMEVQAAATPSIEISVDAVGASASAKLKSQASSFVKKNTKTKQTKAQKLKTCYTYFVKKCSYKANATPNLKTTSWQTKYASQMLTSKKGNCYNYAAGFAAVAKACGYKNVKVVTGTMSSKKPKWAAHPHAWVEIDGKVYDPQAQSVTKIDLYGKKYSKLTNAKYKKK